MNSDFLLSKLNEVFPLVEMSSTFELSFHKDACFECRHLVEDLEEFRKKEITDEVIRLIYQEMSHLSAKAWRWILPHYIKFCLGDEAKYSRMETNFSFTIWGLICNFREKHCKNFRL